MINYIDETHLRVEKIIEFKKLNIKSFEEKIGVSNNSIGTAIRRGSSFKSNVLNKILILFPEINPIWLLTGKGKMLLDNNLEGINSKTYSTKEITPESIQQQLNSLHKEVYKLNCFKKAVELNIDLENAFDELENTEE